MDVEQINRFFNNVYEDGQTFELVAISDGNARRKEFTWHHDALQHQVMTAIATFEGLGFNVYSSAMPREVQADAHYDRIWVDQDDLDGPWPWGDDPDLQWPKPNSLVKTSEENGSFRWQAIWVLNHTITEFDARAMMKRLAALIGADSAVHDPRRVLRVPGVINAKRGVPASLIDTSSDAVNTAQFNLPTVSEVERLMSTTITKPHEILGEWLGGFDEGGRNKGAYVCARFLLNCGVTHDDALSIVNLGAGRCNPPLEEVEIRNAVRSAYHAG